MTGHSVTNKDLHFPGWCIFNILHIELGHIFTSNEPCNLLAGLHAFCAFCCFHIWTAALSAYRQEKTWWPAFWAQLSLYGASGLRSKLTETADFLKLVLTASLLPARLNLKLLLVATLSQSLHADDDHNDNCNGLDSRRMALEYFDGEDLVWVSPLATAAMSSTLDWLLGIIMVNIIMMIVTMRNMVVTNMINDDLSGKSVIR